MRSTSKYALLRRASASPLASSEPSIRLSDCPAGLSASRARKRYLMESPTFGPWPWVTLAAGGISLAAAGAFELSRRSAEDDAREAGDQLAYADSLDAMQESPGRRAHFLGVGAALVTVGATLVIVDLGNDDDHRLGGRLVRARRLRGAPGGNAPMNPQGLSSLVDGVRAGGFRRVHGLCQRSVGGYYRSALRRARALRERLRLRH